MADDTTKIDRETVYVEGYGRLTHTQARKCAISELRAVAHKLETFNDDFVKSRLEIALAFTKAVTG